MAVKTTNRYGKIAITDTALAMVASNVASECYGVAALVSRRLTDSLIELFNKTATAKGVKVDTVKNKINIDIFAVLKDGINVDAVCDSIKSTVKYHVERFSGMRVNVVNVYVVGIRV